VTLAGWVHRQRDHGPVLFIDLRDRYGITQLVADPATNPEARTAVDEARSEYVLQVTGRVQPRPPSMANPNIDTGAIENERTAASLPVAAIPWRP
jgi:aspartyl-tRNA synthetase